MTIHLRKKWVAVARRNRSRLLKNKFKLQVLANLKSKKNKNLHLRMGIIQQSVTKITLNKTKRNINLLPAKRKKKNPRRKEGRKKMTLKHKQSQKLRKKNQLMNLSK